MKILIKNANLVNKDNINKADLLIQDDKIFKIGINISENADKVIEAKDKYVYPGFIDSHTHLRTPGREDEEDLLSGSQAAVKGGFTKIFCMPNTNPAIDNDGLATWIIEESRRIGLLDIYPVGAITQKREGKKLTEFNALKKSGCLCFSDDGSSVKDPLMLRKALEYAKMTDSLIIEHCEDNRISNKGAMRECFISSKHGISAIPDIAESLIVDRDIQIAKYLDTKIHLTHISTAKSIEIIRRAKSEGVKVTCETCPHYFALTVDDVVSSNFNSNFKVNPPLGDKNDLEAIKKALKEGVIDCISTDHAPHSQSEKELPFEYAPFGFIGLELAFSLINTYLVKKGTLNLKGIAEKLAFNPAKILGLTNCGEIKEGYPANLVVVDVDKKWTVAEEDIISKSKNTPFIGKELEGVIEFTIYKGKIVYKK